MVKITKQEFKNYNKQFLPIFARMMKTPVFESLSQEEKEKWEKFMGLLLNQIESGNIFALCGACEVAEEALKEDFSAIKNRAKEHIIARGYYNPISPLTLTEWQERRKKRGWETFKKIWNNEEYRWQLYLEMSEEDQKFIYCIFNFFEQADKIFGDDNDKQELTEEAWQSVGFIWEDILKVWEQAQAKLEQKKKKKTLLYNHRPFLTPIVRLSIN